MDWLYLLMAAVLMVGTWKLIDGCESLGDKSLSDKTAGDRETK